MGRYGRALNALFASKARADFRRNIRNGFADKKAVGQSGEQGAVLVMTAMSIVALLGFVALVVDVGRIYVARAELQNAADTTAMAAAEALPDWVVAGDVAVEYAALNGADHGNILLEEDITTGFWDADTATFYPDASPANAIELTMRRSEQNGNPMGTMFAQVLGFDTVNVQASAVAARGLVDADIVIVQDVTVSFVEEIDEAKTADKALVDTFAAAYANSVRMGAVSFARHSWEHHPLAYLNTGAASLKNAIDDIAVCTSIGSAYGPCYGTDLAMGISTATDVLRTSGRQNADKVIVLVSDGLPCIAEEPYSDWVTTGQGWATAAANEAASHDISIFSVTLYTPSSSSNICSSSDITFNESLARGIGFGATTTDPDALALILTSIIDELPVRLVR